MDHSDDGLQAYAEQRAVYEQRLHAYYASTEYRHWACTRLAVIRRQGANIRDSHTDFTQFAGEAVMERRGAGTGFAAQYQNMLASLPPATATPATAIALLTSTNAEQARVWGVMDGLMVCRGPRLPTCSRRLGWPTPGTPSTHNACSISLRLHASEHYVADTLQRAHLRRARSNGRTDHA